MVVNLYVDSKNSLPENNINHLDVGCVQEINLPPINTNNLPLAANKNLIILNALQQAGVVDSEGKLVTTLRSTEAIPATVFSFEAGHLLNKFLWEEKQLFKDALYPSHFVVGNLLKEIYRLISSHTNHEEGKVCSYAHKPAMLDIEMDSEAAWDILLSSGHLKEFARACVYKGNSREQSAAIDSLFDVAALQKNTVSTVSYTIFCPEFMHKMVCDFLYEAFQESFPGENITLHATCRYPAKGICEFELCFLNGNVCFRLQEVESYSPKTTDKTLSLVLRQAILNRNENQGTAYIKIRHPDPEVVLINKLCDRFELVNENDPCCSLADLDYSSRLVTSIELQDKLIKEVVRLFDSLNSEANFKEWLKNSVLAADFEGFAQYVLANKIDEKYIKNAFIASVLINDKIKQNHFIQNKKNPKIANFVFQYCQSLQKHGLINNVEIFLVCDLLNKKKWIRKQYSHETYTGKFTTAIVSNRLPFDVAISLTTLLTLRFVPSTFGNASVRSLKGVVNMPIAENIDKAIEVLTTYFENPNKIGEAAIGDLAAAFSKHFHFEPRAFAELSVQSEYLLERLLKLMFKPENTAFHALAAQFAQMFKDDRLLPLCSMNVPGLLCSRSRDPFFTLLTLNHLHQNLAYFYQMDSNEKFKFSSRLDWINFFLDLSQKNHSLELSAAIDLLAVGNANILKDAWSSSIINGRVDRALGLLNVFLRNLKSQDDAKNLVIGVVDFFKLIMVQKEKLNEVRPSELLSLMQRVSLIEGLTEFKHPETKKNLIDNSTKKAYQKCVLSYIVNGRKLTHEDRQGLLLNFIVNGQLDRSSINPDQVPLLETLFSAQISLRPQQHNRWTMFKIKCQEMKAVEHEPKTFEIEEIVEAKKDENISGSIVNSDKHTIGEDKFPQNAEIDAAQAVPAELTKEDALENASEPENNDCKPEEKNSPQENILILTPGENEPKIKEGPKKTEPPILKNQPTGLRPKAAKKNRSAKSKKRANPDPVKAIKNSNNTPPAWSETFKKELAEKPFKNCQETFLKELQKSRQTEPFIDLFTLFFGRFARMGDLLTPPLLLGLLSKQEILKLHAKKATMLVDYYLQLSESFSTLNPQLKIETALHYSTAVAIACDQGNPPKGVEQLIDLLNMVVAGNSKVPVNTLNKLGENLGRIIETLHSCQNNELLYGLLAQAHLAKIQPSIQPDIALNIAETMSVLNPDNQESLVLRFNIYKIVFICLSLENQLSQGKQAFPVFVEHFMQFNALNQAVSCVGQMVEAHDIVESLADRLFLEKNWTGLHKLLESNRLSPSHKVERCLAFAEACKEENIYLAASAYHYHRELIKGSLAEEDKNARVIDLVERLSKSGAPNRKKLAYDLFSSFSIPPCPIWEVILKEYSAAGTSQKEEAWKTFKAVYEDQTNDGLRNVLLCRFLEAGFVDPDLPIYVVGEFSKKIGQYNNLLLDNALKCLESKYSEKQKLDFIEYLVELDNADTAETIEGMCVQLKPLKSIFNAIVSTSQKLTNDQLDVCFEQLVNEEYLSLITTQEDIDNLKDLIFLGFQRAKDESDQSLLTATLFLYAEYLPLLFNQVESDNLYRKALAYLPVLISSPNPFFPKEDARIILPLPADYCATQENLSNFEVLHEKLIEDVYAKSCVFMKKNKNHPIIRNRDFNRLSFMRNLLNVEIENTFGDLVLKKIELNFNAIINENKGIHDNKLLWDEFANTYETLIFTPNFSRGIVSQGRILTGELVKEHENTLDRIYDLMNEYRYSKSVNANIRNVLKTYEAFKKSSIAKDDERNHADLCIRIFVAYMNKPTCMNLIRAMNLYKNEDKHFHSNPEASQAGIDHMTALCSEMKFLKETWERTRSHVMGELTKNTN